MNKNYITIAISFLLFAYIIFDLYQNKQTEIKKSAILTEKLSQLEQPISVNNQIIAQREQEKSQDAISIKKLHEQINDAIKKKINVLMSICLTTLLIGCGTVKTEYVYQCNIPASLTQQNNAQYIGKKITWGNVLFCTLNC